MNLNFSYVWYKTGKWIIDFNFSKSYLAKGQLNILLKSFYETSSFENRLKALQ